MALCAAFFVAVPMPAPVAAPAGMMLTGRAAVVSADTLYFAHRGRGAPGRAPALVRLARVSTVQREQWCGAGDAKWECGVAAAQWLSRIVQSGSVTCFATGAVRLAIIPGAMRGAPGEQGERAPEARAADEAVCTHAGVGDLAFAAVAAGWAVTRDPFYKRALRRARAESRGMWRPGLQRLLIDPELWLQNRAALLESGR